jgi:hypothetical protein
MSMKILSVRRRIYQSLIDSKRHAIVLINTSAVEFNFQGVGGAVVAY